MKKVKAVVSPDGKVSLDFIGFVGEECTEERQRLRKILLDLGLGLELERITKKTFKQIAMETDVSEKEKIKSTRWRL